ncbi:MAG: hypothetical protein GY768_29215 [Planctomycetaceae bacterium]|nr:hypothetical protein [Planctomycetaceae bacterium]
MSRGLSSEKVEEWTGRLRRFEQANQTVGRFCLDEGVSQPSFYSWRKKLRELSPAPGGSQFQPVHITSSSLGAARQETIVRLGREIEIELGCDLAIVESVVKQLLAAADQAANATRSTGAESC